MFAVVDIETTGSYATQNGITEIGIALTDGREIFKTYQTLVNPEQEIPPYIQMLTGIKPEMVTDAPVFSEVAPIIAELLEEKVFVAHNVNFDYNFLKIALEDHGFELNTKRICTVQMSRKIIPGMKSYSLGKLTRALQIEHINPHRALGDAMATAKLLIHLHEKDENQLLLKELNQKINAVRVPTNVPRKKITKLPEDTGVYYFHDEKGKVVYVGKAKNIKKRVTSHFAGKLTKRKEQLLREVHDITFEVTGSEMIAYLLEDAEIRQYWPKYNSAQKRPTKSYGVVVYNDVLERKRLAVHPVKAYDDSLVRFPALWEARNWLIRAVEEYALDPTLCGIPGHAVFNEEHNHDEGVSRLLDEISLSTRNFILLEQGRSRDEKGFVLVVQGEYKGFGYVEKEVPIDDPERLEDFLQPKTETPSSRSVINMFINGKSKGVEVIEW